jgi:hypothetical protein
MDVCRRARRELLFHPDAPVPDGATRVRPPWRLFDTLELVKVTRVSSGTDSLAEGAAALALWKRLRAADSS